MKWPSSWIVSVGLVAGALAVPATRTRAVEIQRDIPVPMTDGTNLLSDVYRPGDIERAPTIICRTPYNRRAMEFVGNPFAEHGFIVVIQDVRGMNGSGGQFIPFVHEKSDGLDTLRWVLGQSWCDGRIGLWGPSYVGFDALIVAAQGPESVKAVVNISGWGDTKEMTAPGGALHLMSALPWTLSPQIRGKGSVGDFNWPAAFQHVPVNGIPAFLGVGSEPWEGTLRLFASDQLSRTADALEGWTSGSVAVLHLTGWYDFLARNTLDVYEAIDAKSKGAPAARRQRLIVGPWRHDQVWLDSARVGDEDFGPSAVFGIQRVIDVSLQWFEQFLRDDATHPFTGKPVKLFVMGENAWPQFDRWPPAGVTFEKWYLRGDGSAKGAEGGETFAPEPPSDEGLDYFIYDPDNPVPTVGGANFHFFPDNLGVKDQRPVEARPDVLVYTSPVFAKDVDIIGPLQAVVYAASSGSSADFTAKLVDVRPDGYAAIIEDGIRHGPDLEERSAADAFQSGRVYRYTIDLGATAIAIQKGHRLRIEISSSNFPKYIRNPGTGEDPATATVLHRTEQTVYHSKQFPSHVVLPVLRD